jgi:hypothetical protein
VAEIGVGIGEEMRSPRTPWTPLRLGDFMKLVMEDVRECVFSSVSILEGRFFSGRPLGAVELGLGRWGDVAGL